MEKNIEIRLIEKLCSEQKYIYRDDIHDRHSLERNFREKFQALNKVHLTDAEFTRLMEELTNSDVYASSKKLRERNTFMREDGTPLQYTLVNIKDWCKNDYEVIHQLRMNTRYSSHRYDVILLINGLPLVQIELNWLVEPASAIKAKFYEAIKNLRNLMNQYNLAFDASEVANLKGDDAKAGFINDGEKLYDLIAPLELGWKDRARKEEELMKNLIPLLKRMVNGQKISGLSAYED